jgi:hypothetical protein
VTYDYTCISDPPGWIHVTSNNDGATINDATGFVGYGADIPVSGITDDAHVSFSGYLNTKFDSEGHVSTPGDAASGSMQISFTSLDGDSSTGENASWSAQG